MTKEFLKNWLSKIQIILFLFLLSLPLILPFFRSGFFVTHDGEWAIIRLTAFHFALKDGQFPPRWAGNLFHGFGYPVLNFNYPLPYIIGEIFHLLGFNFVNSIKTVFVLSIFLSVIFIFLLIKEIFNQETALFSVLLYLYYPFRLVDLFVRGSIGESLFLGFLPFSYFSLFKFFKKNKKKWLALSSLGLAFLILSHNSLAYISLPFILIFALFLILNFRAKYQKIEKLKSLILIIILAFGLSCFFWLPALYEKKWTILGPEIILNSPLNHFPSLRELIIPSWGFGQSKAGDSLSFQFGPIHLLLFLVGFFWAVKKKFKLIIFFGLVALINIFFLLPISSFFWQKIPLMFFLTYPWRILAPLGFYFTLVGSFVFFQIKNKILNKIFLIVIWVVLLILSHQQRQPLVFIDRPETFYLTNQATTLADDENTPIWVKKPPLEAAREKIEVDGEYTISNQKSNFLSFSLKVNYPQKVFVNTIYYPGWHLYVDGQEEEIDYQNEKGLISFWADSQTKQVDLIFKETPLRKISDIISLISLGVFIYLLIKIKNVSKKNST